MKNIKYSLMAMVFAAVGLTGCQTSYDAPELETPVATMKPNTTIAELKQLIYEAVDPQEATEDVFFKLGKRADDTDYIIEGRVISSDASGNMYQTLVLQDETAAISLAIRQNSMWTSYRVGQKVVFNATDLYLGTNACQYEIGWEDYYQGSASISFMSWLKFLAHSQKNGMPYDGDFVPVTMNDEWPADAPYTVITTIPEIRALNQYSEAGYKMMSQLVELQNVHFVEGGETNFADYQTSNDYRMIADAEGNTLPLNNSGYSNFYSQTLPTGTGNIRAILTYYNFSDNQETKWQLVLRGIEDVLFNMPGSETDPYTVEEALAQDNSGRTAWTQGYIIGCVKAGVTGNITASDVAFGNDVIAEATNNNVLIADSKDETDLSKCMYVDLPSGSLIREYVNLLDNPSNLGKLLSVQGLLNGYQGVNAIMGCTGADFAIEGSYIPGSKNNPFTVDYVIANPEEQTSKWFEGYIVGYVSGQNFENGATFGIPDAFADYAGTNVIISSKPVGQADITNSIPVNCSGMRETLGLNYQPGNFGKKVLIRGSIGTVLNYTGITDLETAEVGE